MRALAVTLGLLTLPIASSAHHSLAEFDGTPEREIEGEVLRVMWRNPHIRVTLRRENEDGEEEIWDIHGFDLNSLDRRNIPHDPVREGDAIRVFGSLSNRRAHHLYMSNLLTPEGMEILISPSARSLWSTNVIGRPATGADGEAAAGENQSIFRVWSAAAGVRDTRIFPFSEAAIVGRAAWDPEDNFAARCEPEGMPRIMTNPHPFEFVDQGATIELKSELYDLTRIIHIDDAADSQGQPPSPLGYSVGRWEEDTLIVTTSRVNWPYFDNSGTPQSEAVTYEERFTLGQDRSRLNYRLIVTDPANFTEPAVYERYWLDLGEDLQRYDCQVFSTN